MKYRKPPLPTLPWTAWLQLSQLWFDLARRQAEMLTAASQVIVLRSQRIVAAGHAPSARDRREFARMGQEKLDAALEAQLAMARHWPALAAAGQPLNAARAVARVAASGLAPVHRRATANSRRLRKR